VPALTPVKVFGGYQSCYTTGMRRFALAAAVSVCACTNDPDPTPAEVPAIAYCEDVADWEPDHAAFEREVLELVNLRRAKGAACGGSGEFEASEPLTMNAALRCAARKHTAEMIAQDMVAHEFDHEDGDEPAFALRAALAEYPGEPLGQTIAGGQRDPSQVVGAWMSNDGNCATIMNTQAEELGAGYLPASEATYSHYWTLVVGRPGS